MKGYILAIAGATLLSALFTALLPEGKIGNFLKGIARLVVFSAVVTPLVLLFTGHGSSLPAGEIGDSQSYFERCAELLSRKDGESAAAYIRETFGLEAEVEAERESAAGFALGKLHVKLRENGIIGQEEHIDMAERVKTALEERYACAAEVIWET